MIAIWFLLYWIAGIVIMTVIETLFGDSLDGLSVICSIIWPMILVILALVGLYIIIHDSVEKLVKWFKE